jgi:type IV pilus assembly protein PilM
MTLFAPIHQPTAPTVAVDIAADGIAAASLEWRAGQPVVAAHAVEPLAPGALVPSLTALNTHHRAVVAGTLGRVLERVGRPRRIGVILPDLVAKVSLVRFEKVPPRAQDLGQLIRWQVRKTAPFPVEEAQVSYSPGLAGPEGHEFEALCAEFGAHAGIVDLATFNIVNAVLAGSAPTGSEGDWMLVNVSADSSSIAIMRGEHVIFFRNRAADTDAEGTLPDLVHQSAMYYEDRLSGGGFTRVILAGAGSDLDEVRRELEQRLQLAVTPIDPRNAARLTDRIAAAPSLLDRLAPLVGMLLRGRDEARV